MKSLKGLNRSKAVNRYFADYKHNIVRYELTRFTKTAVSVQLMHHRHKTTKRLLLRIIASILNLKILHFEILNILTLMQLRTKSK